MALCASYAPAQRTWNIQNFHTDVDLHKDGSANVIESLTLLFSGEYHGIDRFIPTEYSDPRTHGNYSIELNVIGVTDDDGHKLRYEDSNSRGYERIRIYIPGAVDTLKTVNIQYTVANATKFFSEFDEFYWNVTGNSWQVPITAASAVVHLPEAAHDVRVKGFTGVYGSTGADAETSVNGRDVSIISNFPLSPGEGLTFSVALPKGVLAEPSAALVALRFVRANSILLLPLWAIAVLVTIKRSKGRSADAGASVAAQYGPPDGMTPIECGSFVDDRTDSRDITSVLVDLAVRGYLVIHELSEKHLLHTTKDYELELKRPREQWAGVTAFERIMLDNIFSDGDRVRVSDLKNRFYVAVPKIKESVLATLDGRNLYAVDPNQAFGYVFLAAVVIALPFIIGGYFFHADFFRSGIWAFAAIGVAVALLLWFARHMTATTMQGSRIRLQILGFKEFMQRVDADRLKRMPPDTFEKFLPYAMALGVEQHWAKAFAGIVKNPPSWYQGGYYDPTGFNTFYFMQSLGNMTSTTSEAFLSAPTPTSSGSAFGGGGGGGGFSGGGFGGGGGGAF